MFLKESELYQFCIKRKITLSDILGSDKARITSQDIINRWGGRSVTPKWPSDQMALPPAAASSTDTIIRPQVHTNHLSNGIDQCRKYGNSMATHCDDVSTLLSKTGQSIGQNPIKVESRMHWPHWFRGQIGSQFQDRGIKTWAFVKLKQIANRLLTGKTMVFMWLLLWWKMDKSIYTVHCWVKSKDRKLSWKPSDRGGRNSHCHEWLTALIGNIRRLYRRSQMRLFHISHFFNRDTKVANLYFPCFVFFL